MSIVHHPDFRPERPGPTEFVAVDKHGDTIIVAAFLEALEGGKRSA